MSNKLMVFAFIWHGCSLRTADVFPVVASLPSEGEKRQLEIHLLFAG